MKKELRDYLLTIGLRSAATDKDAWAFYVKLSGDQRAKAREIRGTRQAAGGGGNGDGDGGPDEPEVPAPTTPSERSAPSVAPLTPQQVADAAVAAERQRTTDIRSHFNGEFPELQQRAIDEAWTVERSTNELLQAIRDARSNPVGGGGPGIHTRGGNASTATLQAAVLMRAGVALDNPAFANTSQARAMNLPKWMRQSVDSDERSQIMDAAHELGPQSMVDLCRHALVANGQNVPHNRDEMIRAAFSTGSLEAIYTTNVHARLLASYMEQNDSTNGWTHEFDFENFKENELTTMGKMGRLTRHGRGKTADKMDQGAEMEPMKIFRYDGLYELDEIDIINNRLGNPDSDSPEEMGMSAKRTEIDLVYAVLLQNADLIKDGKPTFTADCNNDFLGGASLLEVLALERAITAMTDQRQRGASLNLMPAYLLVPPRLKFAAKRILNSATLLNLTAGNNNLQGSANVVSDEDIQIVSDTRLGRQGVLDPFSETQIDGNDKQWFLAAKPGVGGAKTIAKGFRTGTGRMPTVRSYSMDKGKWGIGWDICHDIGAKVIDRLAMQRHASDQ